MPRKIRKKIQKTKEEKVAEEYFPVDESNLRYAVEKEFKKPDKESLEKIEVISLPLKKRAREGGELSSAGCAIKKPIARTITTINIIRKQHTCIGEKIECDGFLSPEFMIALYDLCLSKYLFT